MTGGKKTAKPVEMKASTPGDDAHDAKKNKHKESYSNLLAKQDAATSDAEVKESSKKKAKKLTISKPEAASNPEPAKPKHEEPKISRE